MPTPMHRDDARTLVIGVATLVALLVAGLIGATVQTGGALPGRTYTYVTADFEDVGTLGPGKDIRIDGVRVGQVSEIDYTSAGTARVQMRLEGDYDVRRDATASVGNVSALGKKFISLDLGSEKSTALGDDVLGLESTVASASLEDILADIDAPTRASLQRVLGELANGTAAHGADLHNVLRAAPGLLADLETIAGTATSERADLDGLLSSAESLVSRFTGREEQIRGLLAGTDDTMRAVGVDEGRPIEDTFAALPEALTEVRHGLDGLNNPLRDTRSAVRQLRPGAAALGTATPDLRGFLRDSTVPLEKLPAVSEQADPVLGDLTETIADARPLAPRLRTGLSSLAGFLSPFAPYADDTGRFFSQHDLLSGTLQGTDDKHYFAALLTAPGLFSAAGVPDPAHRFEAYPKPGTAWNHATVTDNRKGGSQ